MKSVRIVIFSLFVLFLFSSLVKNIFDYRSKLKFYQEYKEEYIKEKKNNITLKTQVLKKSDPKEVEKTIRNKLNLLQPNEVAIIVPFPTPTPSTAPPQPLPNWKQWWKVYFRN